ncbi:glycosyltransferase family 4 protein [Longirhabdus pacifica]|uniref:glycosyltransferase family 4 protein n=1 Tax=Longirhabdus pacifica TaxID=2305227 RepID=UPI001008BBC0|nr:glycosyltransferase family 4 protein [Longirhabdus pacifica]
MRIAYLDHTSRWSGGEVALYNLLTHPNEDVEPLVILAEHGPLAEKLQEAGVDVRIIPLDEKVRNRNRNALTPSLLSSCISMMRYGHRLGKILTQENIDGIHTNSLKSALYGAVAARKVKKPLIWHIRDQIASPYLHPLVAKTLRTLVHILPDGIITNSTSTLSTLQLPQKKLQRAEIIYSAYADKLENPAHQDHREQPFHVLLVGRLAAWKGQHVLLQAAKLLKDVPHVHFWLAGDALFGEEAYKEELKAFIQHENLQNVTLLGHVDPIKPWLQKAHLLIHTSITPEPFGQVIVEGMACGLPVIASDAGGPKEIVVPNETGLLIEPNKPAVLSEALQWMLDHPEQRKEMGLQGMQRVKQHFVIEQTSHKLTKFYQRLLQ